MADFFQISVILPVRDPKMPPRDLNANKKLREEISVSRISVISRSVGPMTPRPSPYKESIFDVIKRLESEWPYRDYLANQWKQPSKNTYHGEKSSIQKSCL